ncbi:MAG: DUF3048 domain-containing protein, partial [Patescibacteria group bacterium]|nr:DUF3048 domain-containing protein [Patescibacteria group bacterium]
TENEPAEEFFYRHPLSGQPTKEPIDFYPVAVAIDNAYNVRPQYGLEEADIIYEALAEGNITRLLAIFDHRKSVDKLGPIRSARSYFMDWAQEYGGIYMHVGGSPEALAKINRYDFVNIDEMGANGIYFWRDQNLLAPHNVFTSSANWLRIGEMREVNNCDQSIIWNFVDNKDDLQSLAGDFSLNFSPAYQIDWKFNDHLKAYQRWQGGERFLFASGEQVSAQNVIVQVIPSPIIDDKERRTMDTKKGGPVFIFNHFGQQEGLWSFAEGRTRFLDEDGQELKLMPGRSWVQVVPGLDFLSLAEEE